MNNSLLAIICVSVCVLIAAVSQVLLKKSAGISRSNFLREYLNLYVITAYGLLFITTVVNMYALTVLTFKLVSIIGTASYVFVAILGGIIFKENISLKKMIGMTLIILGIIFF